MIYNDAMKQGLRIRLLFGVALAALVACQGPAPRSQVVDAACGECLFAMEGQSCDLAVRIDGVGYFVDGTGIDDHGDAHGEDGFCNAVRPARVTGEIVDGRFVASEFELVSDE